MYISRVSANISERTMRIFLHFREPTLREDAHNLACILADEIGDEAVAAGFAKQTDPRIPPAWLELPFAIGERVLFSLLAYDGTVQVGRHRRVHYTDAYYKLKETYGEPNQPQQRHA
jgi:hypothetical protein